MTAKTEPSPCRASTFGVHSPDRFKLSVLDLGPVQLFFNTFGLEARRGGQRLALNAAGDAHQCGSNYFYYLHDSWGNCGEYSFDIDFVPLDLDWPAADQPPEDSFHAWGPAGPHLFITNHFQP